MTGAGDAGYDEWLRAFAADDGYYLECANGHGSLPPRQVCPDCGSTDLAEEPLPDTGTVETFTVVHTSGPDFAEDVPYVTAIVDFGPVRITGVVIDVEPGDVAIGDEVEPGVGATETSGQTTLVFRQV